MIGHWLNRTVGLWRDEPIADGSGGHDSVWAFKRDIAVKIDQPAHTERQTAGQAESWQTVPIYADPGTDIRRGDQLRTGTRVYRVDGVSAPSTARYLRLECVLLQAEGDQGG